MALWAWPVLHLFASGELLKNELFLALVISSDLPSTREADSGSAGLAHNHLFAAATGLAQDLVTIRHRAVPLVL